MLPPPNTNLPPSDITLFAKTNYRGSLIPFGIKIDDRRRHMYVIGKTGMGKSTLLENMIVQDIRAGRGLAVVDPHGDLVEKVVKYIPSYRINDVVYLNPADADYPVAFNILESVDPTHRHLIASGLISVFKKIWADSWGPRLEHILRNTILALIEYPGSTLLGVTRMLVDKVYRKKVVDHLSDPIVKAFWRDEFAAFNDKFRSEAVSPIQNKIGQFLSSSIIRNIVGQPKSTIDMREIMDHGKILLLNLAKGRIGEDNAGLLGAMMITKIRLAAMSRIDVPETERRDFFLYVDEFQNFATESFASILSEARKYRLDLIIAHQYIEQLDEKVQPAVFGNVGTIICFRVGAGDSEFLAKEFTPVFEETDLVNLTKYDMYLKLMIDGVASEPFSAVGLPPVLNPDNLNDTIIAVSRERYAKPRAMVEDKISRWSGMAETFAATAEEENRFQRGAGDNRPRAEPPEAPRAEPREAMVVVERQPVVLETAPTGISLSEALQSTDVVTRPRPDQANRGHDRQRGHQPRPMSSPRSSRPPERRPPQHARPQPPRQTNVPRPQTAQTAAPVPPATSPSPPSRPMNPPPMPPLPSAPPPPRAAETSGTSLKPGQVIHLP